MLVRISSLSLIKQWVFLQHFTTLNWCQTATWTNAWIHHRGFVLKALRSAEINLPIKIHPSFYCVTKSKTDFKRVKSSRKEFGATENIYELFPLNLRHNDNIVSHAMKRFLLIFKKPFAHNILCVVWGRRQQCLLGKKPQSQAAGWHHVCAEGRLLQAAPLSLSLSLSLLFSRQAESNCILRASGFLNRVFN